LVTETYELQGSTRRRLNQLQEELSQAKRDLAKLNGSYGNKYRDNNLVIDDLELEESSIEAVHLASHATSM